MADEQTQSQNQTQVPPTIQPPPGQTPPPPMNPPPPGSPESSVRMWNMLCHLSALSAVIGVPFGNILGPLVVWQIKKNEYPSVDIHGKAALNFQITVTLAALVVGGSMFFCLFILAVPALMLIGLAGLVFAIIAGIKANNGEEFKYPWSLELIK